MTDDSNIEMNGYRLFRWFRPESGWSLTMTPHPCFSAENHLWRIMICVKFMWQLLLKALVCFMFFQGRGVLNKIFKMGRCWCLVIKNQMLQCFRAEVSTNYCKSQWYLARRVTGLVLFTNWIGFYYVLFQAVTNGVIRKTHIPCPTPRGPKVDVDANGHLHFLFLYIHQSSSQIYSS